MRVTTTAAAGTLESSDVLITVEPGEKAGIEIELEGATAARFGDQIRSVVRETLSEFGVDSCRVRLQDKGALDCTIRARLSAAVLRSSGGDPSGSGAIPWEALK